jgi:hypothetical protein
LAKLGGRNLAAEVRASGDALNVSAVEADVSQFTGAELGEFVIGPAVIAQCLDHVNKGEKHCVLLSEYQFSSLLLTLDTKIEVLFWHTSAIVAMH